MKEEILQRIAEFDAKPLMVKNIILHQAAHQAETNELHAEILKAVGRGICHVVGVIDKIAIVETKDFEDAPFRAVFFDDGKWQRCVSCWPTIEQTLLDAIGTRAEGVNSRFAYYAWSMVRGGEG